MASKYPQLDDREWLEHEYVVLGKFDAQIAEKIGCSTPTVGNARRRHGIPAKRKAASLCLSDKEWLEHEYIALGKPDAKIARELGCSDGTVWNARQRYGISAKRATRLGSIKYPQLNDKAWLEHEYIALEKSDRQIARELGCSGSGLTVGEARRRHGIPKAIRDISGEKNPGWNQVECRCEQCGEIFTREPSFLVGHKHIFCKPECSHAWASEHLVGKNNHRWRGGEIEYKCDQCGEAVMRQPSAAARSKHIFCKPECSSAWQSENLAGEHHHGWKGGATKERGVWFQNGGRQWKRLCRKRDNYICQLCGKVFDKRSKGLHVHHKAGFAVYVELRSVLENGICLCRQCHDWIHSNEGELVRYRWEQEALVELGVAMVA